MDPKSEEIEVGANAEDGTLRFWVAQEAIRQGEIRLASQMAIMTVVTGRASAILGWSVTILLALAAALASLAAHESSLALAAEGNAVLVAPALAAGASMLACGLCCIRVLWPAQWYTAGHNAAWLIRRPYDTELEMKETLAKGYAEGAARNAHALESIDYWLRASWLFFIGSPVVAILVHEARRHGMHVPG